MGFRDRLVTRVPWLRSADLAVLAGLVVVGGLALGFVAIADEIGEVGIDRRILLALRNTPDDPIGPPWFENAVKNLSALGSAAVTGLITVVAVAYLLLAGRRRYAALVAACAGGTLAAMDLLKGVFGRARPTEVRALETPGGLSFPSGHAMISAALYVTLGVLVARALPVRRLQVFAVATGASFALLVGATRVYLGVHYPSDVLGGWTVGLAWALICGLVARALHRRGTVDPGARDAER